MMLTEHDVLARVGSLTVRELRFWVSEGWVAPARSDNGPAFDEMDLARIRLICQCRDELDLHHEAMPVILSLIDQLYGLRRELRALAQAVEEQPEEIRREIQASYRSNTEKL